MFCFLEANTELQFFACTLGGAIAASANPSELDLSFPPIPVSHVNNTLLNI